jgi:hypothetical protein
VSRFSVAVLFGFADVEVEVDEDAEELLDVVGACVVEEDVVAEAATLAHAVSISTRAAEKLATRAGRLTPTPL